MGTAKSRGLGPVHLFMGVTAVTVVMDVSLGTAVTGGIRAGSPGRVATLVTTITATVAQRAETRMWEVTHGILHTGDYSADTQQISWKSRVQLLHFWLNLKCFHTAEMTMTDTTAVAVVQRIITGGRRNPTGTLTEIPGTDAASQRVCILCGSSQLVVKC